MKKQWILVSFSLLLTHNQINLNAQTGNINKGIPIIDVHAHFGKDFQDLDKVMELRRQVKEQIGVDIAVWIDLGRSHRTETLEPHQPDNIEEIWVRYNKRILPCINDYIIRDGLAVPAEELVKWQMRGVAGYKIHCGAQSRILNILPSENKIKWWEIDHPANEPTFTKMEQLSMVAAGMHISSPYLPEGEENWSYTNNAIEHWSAINALERILDRHPDLVIVGAHMLWLCSSKEQLDYLGYLLEKYPNLNVDLTFVHPFLARVENDFTKRFFLKYPDRILLGTDIDKNRLDGSYWDKTIKDDDFIKTYEHFYKPYFELLEEKLSLPADILQKIYFKNAVRIYPNVKEALQELGYILE